MSQVLGKSKPMISCNRITESVRYSLSLETMFETVGKYRHLFDRVCFLISLLIPKSLKIKVSTYFGIMEKRKPHVSALFNKQLVIPCQSSSAICHSLRLPSTGRMLENGSRDLISGQHAHRLRTSQNIVAFSLAFY